MLRQFYVSMASVVVLSINTRSAEPIVQPKPVRPVQNVSSLDGFVTAIERDSITIKPRDKEPVTVPVSDLLAKGGFPDTFDSTAYRIADVRVGDKVSVDIHLIAGIWECVEIQIQRRPGGHIPPSNKPHKTDPYHVRAQAWQDLEEKGIPLPDKYDPKKTIPTP